MKKTLLPILLFLSYFNVEAQQIVSKRSSEIISNTKLIVALTGNEDVDSYIKEAIDKFWNVSEVDSYMPYNKGAEMIKDDEGYSLLTLRDISSSSLTHSRGDYHYRNISSSQAIQILHKGGKRQPILVQPIPSDDQSVVHKEMIFFGIAALNHHAKTIVENNYKSFNNLLNHYAKNQDNLESLDFYMPETFLHKKLSSSEAVEMYGDNLKLVSIPKWKNAILNRESGIVYDMVVSVPLGGKYINVHYMMNAESGEIEEIVFPKVSVSMGGPGMDINLSKANSVDVNKKVMKGLVDAKNSR